ncbi:TetR/AcrR family transcriptional regulator [Nocardia miyunensis]|uniref:TetR/AcrR family transcriptional regulator n=1 Tax=Nocardia miyunensis TaxID=282684 RepID=UPI00082DEA44|nr:TetR/AcrR family transcriptional regulator [Nocardia miyunensis]
MTTPSEKPAWKQRAVERSLHTAKLRAEQRVQRFLDAAQVIITEKGTTDFTVQEVVDRSRQSLRSFYMQFDGKHELLLALFEDALSRTADQLRAAADARTQPLDKLRTAAVLLFELCRPDPDTARPLFTDFAPQLLISHPGHVKTAHEPMLTLFTELMDQAREAGQLRSEVASRRTAAMLMQTLMFIAQAAGTSGDEGQQPISSDEAWDFCARGFVRRDD